MGYAQAASCLKSELTFIFHSYAQLSVEETKHMAEESLPCFSFVVMLFHWGLLTSMCTASVAQCLQSLNKFLTLVENLRGFKLAKDIKTSLAMPQPPTGYRTAMSDPILCCVKCKVIAFLYNCLSYWWNDLVKGCHPTCKLLTVFLFSFNTCRKGKYLLVTPTSGSNQQYWQDKYFSWCSSKEWCLSLAGLF